MKKLIGNDWDEILAPAFESEQYQKLHDFLKSCLLYTSDAADE